MSEPSAKPLITANRVTAARLLPMPLLSWLAFQGDRGIWAAIILGTIIGSTDFVDGYLARKHGPTVLGGLLDPIADKVFIALAYLPFVAMGIFPAWAIALLFVREFVITALRSAYEQRGISLETSYLGKVKTWVQMQGIGFLLLILVVDTRAVMFALIGAAAGIPLLIGIGVWIARRRFWRSAFVMAGCMSLVLLIYLPPDRQLTIDLAVYVIAGFTWLSGVDYLVIGIPQLRRAGGFGRADLVRVAGAALLPCLAIAAMVETSAPFWALAALMSLELAMGGLDNLLSHHRESAGAVAWGARTLGASALLGAAIAAPGAAAELSIAALVVSVAGTAREFWRGRARYL